MNKCHSGIDLKYILHFEICTIKKWSLWVNVGNRYSLRIQKTSRHPVCSQWVDSFISSRFHTLTHLDFLSLLRTHTHTLFYFPVCVCVHVVHAHLRCLRLLCRTAGAAEKIAAKRVQRGLLAGGSGKAVGRLWQVPRILTLQRSLPPAIQQIQPDFSSQ